MNSGRSKSVLYRACHSLAYALAALCLCSCGTPRSASLNPSDFKESQIAPDEFNVSFQGNGNTSIEQAYDLVEMRAAQVALQHRFSHFAVVSVTDTSSARPYMARQHYFESVPPYMAQPFVSPPGLSPQQLGSVVEVQEQRIYYKPGLVLRIKCFATKPEKPFAYDAADLERSLKQKYKMR